MSVSSAIEIERKYAVADHVTVPDLRGVPLVVSADVRPVVHLEAVYVDTADRALLAAGIAVRRRTGGHDAGWHVKLRGTTGRVELHAPIDDAAPDAVPVEFESALRSRVRRRPLVPLARIRTERHAVIVRDEHGGEVEVVDDVVVASDLAAGVLRSWREWEAEQAEDSAVCSALLERVHVALLAAGATPSESPAKIAQALGLIDRRRGAARRAKPTAGSVLAATIAGHAEELHRGIQSLALEGDLEGATVHALRRTVRRTRSMLALEHVAGPAGRALRGRLGDLGRLLGAARDPLVASRTAEALLADLPRSTPGLDAARTILVDEPLKRFQAENAALVDRLGADELLALLADLESFDPDGRLVGEQPKSLIPLAEKTVRRARRRAQQAVDSDLDAMHRARKAAKRARFVLQEVVAAGILPPASALANAARREEAAQDAIGEHRDLALVLASLPDASARLTASGANAYALGVVGERGRRRLAALRHDVERAVRRLS